MFLAWHHGLLAWFLWRPASIDWSHSWRKEMQIAAQIWPWNGLDWGPSHSRTNSSAHQQIWQLYLSDLQCRELLMACLQFLALPSLKTKISFVLAIPVSLESFYFRWDRRRNSIVCSFSQRSTLDFSVLIQMLLGWSPRLDFEESRYFCTLHQASFSFCIWFCHCKF